MSIKIKSFPEIERKTIRRGRYIPSVIKNGNSHHFINLEVFEDGLIDCWGMVDLELFKGKINSGWVVPDIPDGEELYIHNLGQWNIKNGQWLFDKKSYYEYVISVIKSLNPRLLNLYELHGELYDKVTKKTGENETVISSAEDGKPFKRENSDDHFPNVFYGHSIYAFIKHSEIDYSLVNIIVFSDSSIQLSSNEELEIITIEEFEKRVSEGKIITDIPENARVKIYGFGEFTTGVKCHSVSITEKSKEILDIVLWLNGQKTSMQICEDILDEYCKTPTLNLKNELKIAYEKIPSYQRRHLFGMFEDRDNPIKLILYGTEGVKKKWCQNYSYDFFKERGMKSSHINDLMKIVNI